MASAAATVIKDVAVGSIFGKRIWVAIFLRFRTAGTFNSGQTLVMEELVGEGQTVSGEKEVARDEGYTKYCFSQFHGQSGL